jgi:hypothetical protein
MRHDPRPTLSPYGPFSKDLNFQQTDLSIVSAENQIPPAAILAADEI